MTKLEALVKARAVRLSKPKDDNLRKDFLDDWYWIELAQKQRLQLPQWNTKATKAKMINWAHKLNIPIVTYQREIGMFQQIIDDNPNWPLRALIGLMLEWKENRENAK